MDIRDKRGRRRTVLEWVGIAFGAILIGFAIGGFPDVRGGREAEVHAGAGTSTSTSSTSSTTSTSTSASSSSVPSVPPEAARAPSQVKVRLYNGSSVGGAAVRTGNRLKQAGFAVQAPGASTSPGAETTVFHRQGFEAEAVAVAAALSVPPAAVRLLPDPAPVTNTGGIDVVVIVGDDVAKAQAGG